ncbi:ROK family transcriptional regulator [Angelakisella massiliensis]|uniref:ROK family transcriptional regulator n=1 Tax=Angelakisella massiliensis TaxID=1871018 RepID=UPI0008F7EEC9|nr:ROK family transcriptional regulator [Angelakisella massiliensis]
MAIKGRNMVDIKQGNRNAILTLLHEQGGLSRKQLAARLNLTPAAITMIVSEMIQNSILQEGEVLQSKGSAGRKEIMVRINSNDFFVTGVYFGIEQAIVSATDLCGNLLVSETFLYDYNSGVQFVVNRICQIINDTILRLEQQQKRCVGVGIAARGIIDDTRGICYNSYGGWPETDVPLLHMMEEQLRGQVISFQQNVRALANAYIFLNRGQSIESMLFVKNDTGIGAALLFDHKVYSGFNSNAAEMGHIVVERNGRLCRCGGRGCLETVSSMRSIENDVRDIFSEEATPALYRLVDGNKQNVSFPLICRAIQEGDTNVQNITNKAVDLLAEVLRSQICVLDVQRIVLHGIVFENPYFFNRLLESINYDGRYPCLSELITTTQSFPALDTVCSPILAIREFYRRGGMIDHTAKG